MSKKGNVKRDLSPVTSYGPILSLSPVSGHHRRKSIPDSRRRNTRGAHKALAA